MTKAKTQFEKMSVVKSEEILNTNEPLYSPEKSDRLQILWLRSCQREVLCIWQRVIQKETVYDGICAVKYVVAAHCIPLDIITDSRENVNEQ